MSDIRHGGSIRDATEITTHNANHFSGGRAATLLSAVAVLFSAFSLWDTSLKSADLRVYVPRVIYFAAPYQNTNFEVISIPVTIANEGAQSGTVLHMDLAVTDPRTKQTKNFYAAEFGVWSMERTRNRSYTGFAPVALEGRSSRTESILFYTRGDDEKPDQMIREVGPYEFTLTVTPAEGRNVFGMKEAPKPITVSFERILPFFDARAFESGTIFMHAKDWKTSTN
jgi:hypothetical protein